ncbi:MAG: hypothetical protein PHT37_07400 [Candidatus Cloacimonetes bacterium]|nr:hypothetical protein [Candidatus Cloacimonadota bacterium]
MRKVDIIILSVCALLVVVSVAALLLWFNQAESSRAVQDDPINFSRDPIQDSSVREALPVLHFGKRMVVMNAKAKYTIDGQLVSKKRYTHSYMNELAPYDFALTWGDMPKYLNQIKFSQSSRFCLYKMKKNATVDPKYMQNHMSNNHLIPASNNIKKAMRKARKGDLIRIEGHLVHVETSKAGRMISSWNSSVTREDTGDGACEIIYVTRLRIGDMVYE